MSFAFLFPGQGSQTVGMFAAYAEKHKEIKQAYAQASAVLAQDLFKLVSAGPEAELNLTVNTQPAMLAAGVGVWRAWKSLTGAAPGVVSGHSLGEYSALTCAGVFEFEDAVRVVRKRAELMQAAVPAAHGAMAVVIGLDAGRVADLCAAASAGEIVEAVNFNTDTQIVVAGHAAAVERLSKLAPGAGARRCVALPISVPAHSSLMKDAARAFAEFLSQVPMHEPAVRVLHNTDVEAHAGVGEIRAALVAQLHTPVRWLEIVRRLSGGEGVRTVIEVGPGRVLTGLNRRIDKTLSAFSTDTPESLAAAVNEVTA